MTKFFKQKNKKKGFTIIEVLVALFIFALAVAATMAVLSSGVSSINTAKKKMQAEYLAQEGIEVVRNIRDTYALKETSAGGGWSAFLIKFNNCAAVAGCSFNDSTIASYSDTTLIPFNTGSTTSSGFTRFVRVESVTGGVKVSSTVSWGTGKSVTFSDYLYNWIETVSPTP